MADAFLILSYLNIPMSLIHLNIYSYKDMIFLMAMAFI